jgi:hypothetical protein
LESGQSDLESRQSGQGDLESGQKDP